MSTSSPPWRPRPWAAVVTVAAVGTTAIAHRYRSRAGLLASVVVMAGQAVAYSNARRALKHALGIGPDRRSFEDARARAYGDLLLDTNTHVPVVVYARQALLRLEESGLEPETLAAVTLARREIASIEAQLQATAAERARDDLATHARLIGGFAAGAPSRRGDPLRLYGVRRDLRGIPAPVNDVVQLIGAVLDEVRLLHTADIEWSTLLFTMWARAGLVGLAPALSSATAAPVRLQGAEGAVWAVATGLSIVTAGAAPTVASAAMDRGPGGARVRRTLLRAEVPVACALAYTQPAWMTSIFASGWTNWAQRPVFRWPRLAVFVGALTGLQGAGMARRNVPPAQAAAEIAATLTTILYTGSSYGAMLPLSASTCAEVVLGGGRRQARAAREARERMLAVAALLRAAGEAVTAAAPDAAAAVASVLDAAETLERKAAAIAQPPAALADLVATAYRRSDVPFRGSAAAATRREDALSAGQPAPVVLRAPTFAQGEPLRLARVGLPKDARVLHDVLVILIEEAELHGTDRVFVWWGIEGSRLVLRVGNEKRDPPREGQRGSGKARLERLVRQLSLDGRVDHRGDTTAAFVGLRAHPGWFGVQISCAVDVLSGFPHRVPSE